MRTVAFFILMLAGVSLPARSALADRFLPFGVEGLTIPEPVTQNPATPRLVSLIAAQLQVEPSPSRRARLVRDLGMTARPEAVEPVVAALSDPQPMVRASAVDSLRRLDARSRSDALRPLLNDPVNSVRVAAYHALVAWDPSTVDSVTPPPIDPLSTCLSRATPPTTREAALIAKALTDLPASQQATALRQLARHKSAEHVPVAARFLKDPRVANVLAALEVVAANAAASDAALVRPLLAHAHPRIRAAAVTTLDRLGAEDRGAVALRALDDADPEVRVAACRVLGRSPSDASVPKLCEQLDDGYPPLRQAAREALVAGGEAGTAAVITQAVAMISGDDPRRQEDGSYILGQLRRDVALERHIELTRSEDLATASQAARSLTRIGRREAGPAMLEMFQRLRRVTPQTLEVSSATRDAVLGAGELGERGIVPALKKIVPDLEREAADVRAAGAWVLGVLGDASDASLVKALSSRMTVELESSEVQFESAKALGALRAREALSLLRELGKKSFDPAVRYMSHLSADRIEGTTTPFERMVVATPLETLVEETQPPEQVPDPAPGP